MRPVEELQRDVLHLLLVDHAEVQPVVHVVLAQGPAAHARRHFGTFVFLFFVPPHLKTFASGRPRPGPAAAAASR